MKPLLVTAFMATSFRLTGCLRAEWVGGSDPGLKPPSEPDRLPRRKRRCVQP
jgi:hypothetical protein